MCVNEFTVQRERSGQDYLYITLFHDLQEILCFIDIINSFSGVCEIGNQDVTDFNFTNLGISVLI